MKKSMFNKIAVLAAISTMSVLPMYAQLEAPTNLDTSDNSNEKLSEEFNVEAETTEQALDTEAQVIEKTVPIEESNREEEVEKAPQVEEEPKESAENLEKEEPIQSTNLYSAAIEKNAYLSLDSCLKLALNYNPLIKASLSNTEIKKSKVGQAWASYFPTIDLSAGSTRLNPAVANSIMPNYDMGDVGLSAMFNQLIFDFGKTPLNAKVNKENLNVALAELKNVTNNVILNVKTKYYDYLYSLDRLKVMQESVMLYLEQYEQAKAFYEVGSKPKIDVLSAQTNLSTAKLALIQAGNNVEIAKATLNNAMGLMGAPDYFLKDKLSYNKYKKDFNTVLDTAYKNRPDYHAVIKQQDVVKSQIKLAKRHCLPSLKGFAGYSGAGRHTGNLDDGWQLGVKMDVPVNLYFTKKLVDEANATYSMNSANIESVKQNLYLEVKRAHSSLIEAEERIPVSKTALAQAKENFKLAQGRYENGVGNQVELKDAEVTLKNAKLNHFLALRDYNVAVANLEKAIGKELTKEKI